MGMLQAWYGVVTIVEEERKKFTVILRHEEFKEVNIQLVFNFRDLTYKSDVDNVKPGARLTWLINNEREVLEFRQDRAHIHKYWMPALKSNKFEQAG